MKIEDFKNMIREIIREEIKEQAKNWWTKPAEAEVDAHILPADVHEKSVPQPYNRNSPPRRPMTKSQIDLRKKIGQAMMRDEKKVSKFRKKYGDEWKDYLWAAATSAAFRQAGSNKGDDKRKK